MEMGIVGAAGKLYFRLERRGLMDGSISCMEDQPEGPSPSPCRKMRAADLHVDGVELRAVEVMVRLSNNMDNRNKDTGISNGDDNKKAVPCGILLR